MSLFTVPQVMATSLVIEHGQLASLHTASLTAWLAFAYTVLFGAVAGWGLWFWLIARCSITRVAPFALLQIVFAVFAGVVFLHEALTPTLVAGAVICIVGVAITQSRSFARHRLPTAPRRRSNQTRRIAVRPEADTYAYAAQWPEEVSHLVFKESSLPCFGQEETMEVDA
jgi:uncharacterized membrane protein